MTLEDLASAIATAEGYFAADPNVIPRRLNNPGDLKFAGQLNATKDETGFARFSSPQAGIVGLYRQILASMARGISLRQLITGWAPPNENDTSNYLAETIRRLGGIDPDVPLWDLIELRRLS